MAQNIEPFHVPQQNRRNKLRVTTNQETPLTLSSSQTLMNSSSSSSSLQSPQNLRDFNYQSINGQGNLSLSLSVHHHGHFQNFSEQQNYAVSVLGDYLKHNSKMRSSVPLGPFTGYASILKHSRFLKPAQQILDDLCGVDFGASASPVLECLSDICFVKDPIYSSDRVEHPWKNSKLILMLDEVYSRYKLYCQQMQSVVASFETVSGLGNAAPYISFAFKAIAKHFSWLKNAILDQIQLTGRTLNDESEGKNKISRPWSAEQGLHGKKTTQNPIFLQNSLWRSQRGLPDHAVAVLRTWMFENFLHPYPTDSEKQMLSLQTGLSRTQVSNWFINARVRLWKPMVEEIHMLEEQKARATAEAVSRYTSMPSNNLHIADALTSATPSMKAEEIQAKRRRSELANIYEQNAEQKYAPYSNLSSNHHIGVSESSSVILALGLHQNNGTQFSQPFPIHISQPFNIETNSELNMKANFEGGYQHLGKDL